MPLIDSLRFDEPTVAAASAGGSFWRATPDHLEQLDPETGRQMVVIPATGVISAAGSELVLLSATGDGDILGMDPASGRVRFRHPESGAVPIASTTHVWLWRQDLGIASRVSAGGVLEERVAVGAAQVVVGDGSQLWWVGDDLRLHRSDGAAIDPSLTATPTSATVCGGALWLSDGISLVHVSVWSGKPGAPVESPIGPIVQMTCSGGRLICANDEGNVAVLDPASDQGITVIDHPPIGHPVATIGTKTVGWVLSAEEAVILRA